MQIIQKTRCAALGIGLLCLLILLPARAALGAESPDSVNLLLDLFVKKGYVTQGEADKLKAEAEMTRSNVLAGSTYAPSKWKISDGLKSVELFGDLRVRFEDRKVTDPKDGRIDLQRLRYAARLGLRGDLFDDFYYGFRLDTAANSRSPWVTLGTSSSGKPYQGPFGKSTSGIDIGQLYMGWRPESWVDITLGKMPNPLYTTPLVWDTDINPEGAAERFKYSVGEADFFANFGQYIYQDTNPNEASFGYFGGGPDQYAGGSGSTFLLAWQAGMNYHLTKDVTMKVAPAIYIYTSAGVNTSPGTPGFSDIFVGQGAQNQNVGGFDEYPNGYYDGFNANQTGINNLEVLEIPFEINFPIKRFHGRIFGDYAYNLDGSKRAENAYTVALAQSQPTFTLPNGSIPPYLTTPIPSPQTHDVNAYQIGFGIGSSNLVYGPMQGEVYGSSSRKHAWELRTYWQHIEQYALDPNLIDSDFFEGRGNLEGVYASLAYGLSDNVIATLRYGYAQRINKQLGTGGSNQDIPQMNPIEHYNLLQVDATVRF